MKITILGAGAYGGALGAVLAENGHIVQYFDPYKYPRVTLKQALTFTDGLVAKADTIVLVVPSKVAPELLAQLPANIPLICASKGFLSLAPFRRFNDFSVLSGPAFAAELRAKQPTTLTATDSSVSRLFTTTWLRFDQTTDRLGVLLCGTLKNVYAIGAGYFANLQDTGLEGKVHSDNRGTMRLDLYPYHGMSAYLQAALAELKVLLDANGADSTTANLACGVGDLNLTCSSAQSRNYQFGRALAIGATLTDNTTVEGLSALRAIADTPDFVIPPACLIFKNVQELTNAK